MSSSRVARWNETSWVSANASILGGDPGRPTLVSAREVFDDPVAGRACPCARRTVTDAAGMLVNRLVAWDGIAWSTVGEPGNGFSHRRFQSTTSLAVLPG